MYTKALTSLLVCFCHSMAIENGLRFCLCFICLLISNFNRHFTAFLSIFHFCVCLYMSRKGTICKQFERAFLGFCHLNFFSHILVKTFHKTFYFLVAIVKSSNVNTVSFEHYYWYIWVIFGKPFVLNAIFWVVTSTCRKKKWCENCPKIIVYYWRRFLLCFVFGWDEMNKREGEKWISVEE